MEWPKVKNIIILMLLLVNGFLLLLVGARRGEALRYEQAALYQAAEVLEGRGIEVDLSAVTGAEGLKPLSVERDVEREARMAGALLGETVQGDDRGGGLYLYRGELGELSLRLGGELSAMLEDDERWQTEEPEDHAASLLRQMDVDAELLQAARDGGTVSVTFRQRWEGRPLFSCQVTFVYREGRLRTVQGNLLASGGAAAEQGELLSLPTAMLQFLDYVRGTGDVCSAIHSMTAGYRVAQSFSSTTRLNVVWLISTNTANYYLDASTGTLTRLTDEQAGAPLP